MAERVPLFLWSGLAALAATLFAGALRAAWPASFSLGAEASLETVILAYSILPRATVAILAGAALGLSGLLLQQVLRNPLAEPSTLGISAGAQLALAAATAYASPLVAAWPGGVAFAGGAAAVVLVLALTWRRGIEPVAVVLAGMMVALTASAVGAALVLLNGDYLFSLFIWGGGSLVQQGWGPALALAPPLVVGLAAAMLLLRPLAVLGLDEAAAKSLGVALHASRFLTIALAVWIATTVTAAVGVIGFVGLAAPAFAALSGARTLKARLAAAPLIGAILLWLADGLVQLLSGGSGERLPTGAATALVGGPLLLWLLPRLRTFEPPSLASVAAVPRRAARPWLLVAALSALAALLLALALAVGRGPAGWSLPGGGLLADLVAWRMPRVTVAGAAGAMLAAAGVVLQRLTGNPLAGPEVLGVGAGAGAGLAAVLMVWPLAGFAVSLAGSALGALLALALLLALASRQAFGPERFLLAGVAIGAACSAVVAAVISLGNAQSYAMLRWLSGSTNDATAAQAWIATAAAIALSAPLFLATRWLDILPLGGGPAAALGVPVARSRLLLVAAAALLGAFAALLAGPLSFVGLVAPHLARLIGLARARHHLAGALVIGAGLMVLSDWLSRMAAFPYQLPVGLFAALIGAPYLAFLLGRGVPRRG